MSGVIGVNGATLPAPALAPARSPAGRGFLVVVVSYPSGDSRRAVPVAAPRVFAGPRDAIRAIREQARAGAGFDMSPGDIAQAATWAEHGWRVPLALLGVGAQVGLTLLLESGEVAEWSARPVHRLGLNGLTEQGCYRKELNS
ncbi:hypothetical protein [Streptomyces sp. CC208A]|uniref:hypothetical protein n=1 Tax=Streptomyces sp. CC208A TaxID=3044573 RepID=UPI0024A8E06D|nr:hypothetical protein [Streptomyces sp. CC208A]